VARGSRRSGCLRVEGRRGTLEGQMKWKRVNYVTRRSCMEKGGRVYPSLLRLLELTTRGRKRYLESALGATRFVNVFLFDRLGVVAESN